jgi:hypothetical protein
VVEQAILVLIQIVEANGTLQLMLDPGRSDGADGVIVIAAFWCQSLLVVGGHKMHIFTANIPAFHARYRR